MAGVKASGGNIEVFPWVKSLPVAPEYYPTLVAFQDPISYIFKIEKEASKYGICKIIPPLQISPNVVLVMSIGFIVFVAILHVMGKLYFVRIEA